MARELAIILFMLVGSALARTMQNNNTDIENHTPGHVKLSAVDIKHRIEHLQRGLAIIKRSVDPEGADWTPEHPIIRDIYEDARPHLLKAKKPSFWMSLVEKYGDRIATIIDHLLTGKLSDLNKELKDLKETAKEIPSQVYDYGNELFHQALQETMCLERILCHLDPVRERLLSTWMYERLILWGLGRSNMLSPLVDRFLEAAYLIADAQIEHHSLCPMFTCRVLVFGGYDYLPDVVKLLGFNESEAQESA